MIVRYRIKTYFNKNKSLFFFWFNEKRPINPHILMLELIGLCYNQDVLTIIKLDIIIIIIKHPMATWDYGFGN